MINDTVALLAAGPVTAKLCTMAMWAGIAAGRMQTAFDALRSRGAAVPPEPVHQVAPPGWEHISLTGDYVWAEEARPAPGLLRPLRDKPSLLAA